MFSASKMQAMMASTKTLTFKVTKKNQELICPEKSTPYEFKYLSDTDDSKLFRCYFPGIQFFQKSPHMEGKDPATILRDAIAKALVFYYPVAGRLREYASGKLVVECTGDGVLFIEADADITLHQFGDSLCPPFPYLKQLLLDFPEDNNGVINQPLVIFQVTRLRCGGFILAHCLCHVMFDGTGFVQFMSAVAELARGAAAPSIAPAWERHLLTARSPPRVSFRHREYDVFGSANGGNFDLTLLDQMVERNFFFSTADISALRRSLPPHLQSCSTFDIVAACAWRCRTIALFPEPDTEVRFICFVDVRKQMKPRLPAGYYGNVVALPAAVTSAEKLWTGPLSYAVELVRKAKHEATGEYLRSVADLMVAADRPPLVTEGSYVVSDLTNVASDQLDYGWGTATYSGVAKLIHEFIMSWYVPFHNQHTGEHGIIVPACLPEAAMEVFAKHMMIMTSAPITSPL